MLRCLLFIWKRCTVILKLDCSWRHDRITELPLPYLARALTFNFTLATYTSYILIMTCFHSLWATANWSWCTKIPTELLEHFLQINSILNLSIFPEVFSPQQTGAAGLVTWYQLEEEQWPGKITWLLNHWPCPLSLTFVSVKIHELWAC